jgi:hypothetical protein
MNERHSHPLIESRDEPDSASPADLQAVLVAYRMTDERLDQHAQRAAAGESRIARLEETVFHHDSLPIEVETTGLVARGSGRWIALTLALFVAVLLASALNVWISK